MRNRSRVSEVWSEECAPVPKLWGSDIELGNFVKGARHPDGTGRRASRLLLEQIAGMPDRARANGCYIDLPRPAADLAAHAECSARYNPQDWGRRCLPTNGGFAYIDLDHLEICTPETRSVREHVAARHAMLRVAAQARESANLHLEQGERIEVMVNNTDGRGNAYGSHLNILTNRRTFDRIFSRPHYLGFLASFQASFLVCSGQGKVGSENGRAPCAYQISQRADFIETLVGPQTTYSRPLVNSRDEPLAGNVARWRADPGGHARLHIIYLDNALCHGTIYLAGVHLLLLALMECDLVNSRLQLEDPVGACHLWSRDLDLATRLPLQDGTRVSATELQLLFADEVCRFVDKGGCDGGIVAEAGGLARYWVDTLEKLDLGEPEALVGRLDWVLKKRLLERAIGTQGLGWESPEIKYLDHLYGSLDFEEGLYWQAERAGVSERLVGEGDVQRLMGEPPADTRARARVLALRALEPEAVRSVDWDAITYQVGAGCGFWPRHETIRLDDPLGGGAGARGEAADEGGITVGGAGPAPAGNRSGDDMADIGPGEPIEAGIENGIESETETGGSHGNAK